MCTHTHIHTPMRSFPQTIAYWGPDSRDSGVFHRVKGKGPVWGLAWGSTAYSKTPPEEQALEDPVLVFCPAFAQSSGQDFGVREERLPAIGHGQSLGFVWALQPWRASLLAENPRASRSPQNILKTKAINTLWILLSTGSIPNQNEKWIAGLSVCILSWQERNTLIYMGMFILDHLKLWLNEYSKYNFYKLVPQKADIIKQ